MYVCQDFFRSLARLAFRARMALDWAAAVGGCGPTKEANQRNGLLLSSFHRLLYGGRFSQAPPSQHKATSTTY
eukprot:2992074-Amphidinium_carterae.3